MFIRLVIGYEQRIRDSSEVAFPLARQVGQDNLCDADAVLYPFIPFGVRKTVAVDWISTIAPIGCSLKVRFSIMSDTG
ncbi:hypothetical protein [Tunturiibacter lichenicola]|jgi:hypothetical protein|uniref:hypothetical protein n=1 Tax=Tunturiibacter lichenicola TaxID=2051959 RepID=UPI0021B2CC2F|nr:hypothetical protein [Edaphobacter lichenicola]